MTCRKRRDDVETAGKSLTRDELRRQPVYGLSGIRHEGGLILPRGGETERGNLRLR